MSNPEANDSTPATSEAASAEPGPVLPAATGPSSPAPSPSWSPPPAVVEASDAPWANWDQKVQFASRLIATGFLPANIKTPAQVIAIIMTGQELGLPPMQSLRQINVISGKPTMSAELMMAKMLQGGVTLEWVKNGDDGKEAVLKAKRKTTSFTGRFTIEQAREAGLMTKDGWRKYPGAMLRARVISLVARVVAPDLISGTYTPEEMGAEVSATGEIINEATGAAPINAVVMEPRVVIQGDAVPILMPDELLARFKAAGSLEEVAEVRRLVKATAPGLEWSLKLSQAWLDAKNRLSTQEPA